jgi:hypoxia up-regulated 1
MLIFLGWENRKLEQPVVHRYNEIKEFPHALNNSQMWNWSTRMFLTEAKMNLSVEEQGGEASKYTREELDGLEKALKAHETWLNEVVEKQKTIKYYEDPAVESSELKAKSKMLENHLQRLAKKKTPKKKTSSSSSSSSSSGSSSSTGSGGKAEQTNSKHDEL